MSELQQLRDRVAELEDVLGMTAEIPRDLFPADIHLGRLRAAKPLIGMLLKRDLVPADAAYDALYGARPEVDQPGPNMISVLMVYVRKTLKPHGITVKCLWGKGWYLTAEDKAKLRALIEAHK